MDAGSAADIAAGRCPGLRSAGLGNRTGADESAGQGIQPQFDTHSILRRSCAGQKTAGTAAKIYAAKTYPVSVVNGSDIHSTFRADLGSNTALLGQRFSFYTNKRIQILQLRQSILCMNKRLDSPIGIVIQPVQTDVAVLGCGNAVYCRLIAVVIDAVPLPLKGKKRMVIVIAVVHRRLVHSHPLISKRAGWAGGGVIHNQRRRGRIFIIISIRIIIGAVVFMHKRCFKKLRRFNRHRGAHSVNHISV